MTNLAKTIIRVLKVLVQVFVSSSIVYSAAQTGDDPLHAAFCNVVFMLLIEAVAFVYMHLRD